MQAGQVAPESIGSDPDASSPGTPHEGEKIVRRRRRRRRRKGSSLMSRRNLKRLAFALAAIAVGTGVGLLLSAGFSS